MPPPALIMIDVQRAIDEPLWGPRNNPDAETVIATLLGAWRAAKAPIFHVKHNSTSPHSPYSAEKSSNAFKPEAMPLPHEPVVTKRTNSAFIGTSLEWDLRHAGLNRLVIAGVITNNSLEASVRSAGNLGFDVWVPEDACWTVDKVDVSGHRWTAQQVHDLSLANMHEEYATVCRHTDALSLLE